MSPRPAQPLRLPTPDDADRALDGYARAQAILRDQDAPPEELAAYVERWHDERGLHVRFIRSLEDDGLMAWRVWVTTGRGVIKRHPEGPQTWRTLLADMDLLPPGAPRA
jgi:hypothetical protein